MNTDEMIEQTDIYTALAWHLQYNHYPAVPLSMMTCCIAAIHFANNGEDDTEVFLPHGVTYQGRIVAPAWAIIRQHHLEPFLN